MGARAKVWLQRWREVGGQPVSRTWRHIRTVKALALSVLIFIAFVAAVIVRRRRLDADPFRHSRHEGYRPTSSPVGDRPGMSAPQGNRVEGLLTADVGAETTQYSSRRSKPQRR